MVSEIDLTQSFRNKSR